MSTIWWILWTIGIVDISIGMIFSLKSNRQKVLMGWMLMSIGLIFNGVACLVNIHCVFEPITAVISFVTAYADYSVFKRKQKEFDIKELGIKEKFLRDLRDYKFKLDKKNHKIV
jgi:cytochrome bd-type quinol oxidase subunit 1